MTRAAAATLRGARAVQAAAQAKVNLRLRILAREASGFHQLETLLLRLELADTVRVRRTASARSLDVSGADPSAIGPAERNLAWRAAVAYCDAAGWTDGFAIELEKRIPIGGGLGGGSADAGAVLRAMDAMAAKPIGEAGLLRIAFTLGADVPFLASEHAYALAWGRGERLLALKAPPRRQVVLVGPPFGVSTTEAYGWLAAPRASAVQVGEAVGVLSPARLARWEAILPLAANDFEPVVATRHPAIADLVAQLRAWGAQIAMMSGSGSVVFGVMPASAEVLVQSEGAGRGPALVTHSAVRVEPVVALD
ncbi:MAG TPA: 4-(cytidine 5'-diphospho)-2-C-methyl-D-erythritol kinase [Gemmatimonadaceae bacterium]|nr:4-(cytidine 5'-diphospho)-2-C-methyl-D-erythritol kinase [Gemmatimonadaceae bacterium]